MNQTLELAKYPALLALGVGIYGLVYFQLADSQSKLRVSLFRYQSALDKELRFQLLHMSGKTLLTYQAIICFVWCVLCLWLRSLVFWCFVPPILFFPFLALRRKRVERVNRLENQLDAWLLVLANALRASPSLGDALNSSSHLVPRPMSEELDIVMKEHHLGLPLDQAIYNFSDRVNSRSISSALITLLIARQSGGNLPDTLEIAAATLREMARLDGVVRTKTAEGKSQAWVLGAMPFVLVGAIHWIDPKLLMPLVTTFHGYVVSAIAVLLWVFAIVAARKILAVDI